MHTADWWRRDRQEGHLWDPAMRSPPTPGRTAELISPIGDAGGDRRRTTRDDRRGAHREQSSPAQVGGGRRGAITLPLGEPRSSSAGQELGCPGGWWRRAPLGHFSDPNSAVVIHTSDEPLSPSG